MLEILQIFPLYLRIITVLFVIIPTLIIWALRISLYHHLFDLRKKTYRLVNGDSQGKQPQFLERLQDRFSKASKQIENVNSLALIDGVYYQETFRFFWGEVRCEQGEYITKIMPNLLLAFGLLGTFLGITLNLNSISEIINQGGSEITDLTNQLQTPLQSMALAFLTSLIALLCSSFLTVINIKNNVNFEKNSLLNNLEDYLDNIYKPQVEGDTRLDKAVNRMVEQQHDFLLRFHDNVGQVLEKTFKQASDRMADENEKSQKLAIQVYQQLFDSCSALHTGANIFQNTVLKIEERVDNLAKINNQFENNIESLDLSSKRMLHSSEKIENSKFSENIEQVIINLTQVQTKFAEATNLLANSSAEIIVNNQQTNDLAKQVYEHFRASSGTLEESAMIFADSAITIKESKFNEHLFNTTNNLNSIVEKTNEVVKTLNEIVKPITVNVKTLELSAENMVKLSENVDDINNRYLEMTNLSRDILLRIGEVSVNTKNSYNLFADNMYSVSSNLEQKLQALNETEKQFIYLAKEILDKFYLKNDDIKSIS